MKWEKKLIYLRTKRCRQRQLEWGWPWQFNESSKFNGPTLNKVTCYIKITTHIKFNLSQPPHHVDSDNHQPSTTPTSMTSWQRPHLSTQLQQQVTGGLRAGDDRAEGTNTMRTTATSTLYDHAIQHHLHPSSQPRANHLDMSNRPKKVQDNSYAQRWQKGSRHRYVSSPQVNFFGVFCFSYCTNY